jgi:4-amino-4-deoxy-L-arabinose transferase-like glycosyltransferase
VSRAAVVAGGAAATTALWLRVHNARTYPADWGFDARFNWEYIALLSRSWQLPPPDVGWSTGDPPLYFALAALLVRAAPSKLVLVPLLNVLLGLAVAGLAAAAVHRVAPGDRLRTALAAGLVLFLPAHVHMSAMVNEELLCATFTSLALWLVARPPVPDLSGALLRSAICGLAAGLALLSKLTGALTVACVALALLVEGVRLREPRRCALQLTAALGATLLAGGWFYLRNRVLYGYFQPFGLPAHQVMFSMPPGSRELLDYLYVPLSTFTDPQLLDPDLLHSVWGSTYASLWFDAHRSFLPSDSEGVRRLGSAMIALGLLPTAAFLVGFARGARRALAGDPVDVPLVALVLLTLAGFALYTWQNPWFAVVKGTTLLGLCVPFAVYASEALRDWVSRGRTQATVVGALLCLLAIGVVVSGTFNGLFERKEVSGLSWERVEAP